jgi:hypothetical protein
LRFAVEAIVKATRRQGLRFLDDALQLTRFESSGLAFDVVVEQPYSPTRDEVPGVFDAESLQVARTAWVADYDEEAQDYLTQGLEHLAARGTAKSHDCKLGFVTFDAGLQTHGDDTPAIGVRPINNVVCDRFNLAVGKARVDASDRRRVEARWARWLEALLRPQSAFRMPCPSQLFLELVVVTSDGAIPRPVKVSETSIYSLRNGGDRIYTCGIEDGARWTDVVQDGAGHARLDFSDALLNGLAREYRIRGAATDSRNRPVGERFIKRGGKLLQCVRPPRAGLFTLVVQGMHLNSAVLGYCVLPITGRELASHLEETVSAGGLDFTNLELIALDDCAKVVADFEDEVASGKPATAWHGTAMMRLQLAVKHRAVIEAAMGAMQRS